jgi:sugar O-acyltransferase (sialic acid O-acetyltransferase NeuD family)
MSRRLAILGAGGHGKVVADTAVESGWDDLTFFDDGAEPQGSIGGWLVVGGSDALRASLDGFTAVVVAIGHNRVRLAKTRELIAVGAKLATLIHPRAYVARDVRIGPGTVVLAGAVVQPGSAIGTAVIVNTGATVDHDCALGDGVHVCPGANVAGCVSVGDCAWLGIGCSVRQTLTIGADAVVGGGAAVVADVADGTTVVGVPARPMKEG